MSIPEVGSSNSLTKHTAEGLTDCLRSSPIPTKTVGRGARSKRLANQLLQKRAPLLRLCGDLRRIAAFEALDHQRAACETAASEPRHHFAEIHPARARAADGPFSAPAARAG